VAVPTLPVDSECDNDHQARNGDPLAPARIPSVLALEVPPPRWSSEDQRRDQRPDTADEPREPAWGAPRIRAELLMLGIDIAESTVGSHSRFQTQGLRPMGHKIGHSRPTARG